MQFTHEINRLVSGMLIVFGIVVVSAAYWALIGPDTLTSRQDNPRLVEAEAAIMRGSIFDRDGNLLVTSERDASGSVTRRYLQATMNSALGYFSLRYGVSGAESAFNQLLRGDGTSDEALLNKLLHRAQQGADIRVTLDSTIQQEAVSRMGERAGAVVVVDVRSGEVLALASLPTFDPNQLDAEWEQLTASTGNPFFNRAIQGSYQPGGTLYTLLMTAAILEGSPLNLPIENAAQVVRLRDIDIGCLTDPGRVNLTLEEAYRYGCPAPFAQLVTALGADTVRALFETFALDQPPTLPGYIAEVPGLATSTPVAFNLSDTTIIDEALGQGTMTITPLEMALIAAAVVNDGNAPTPYTLLATRQPGAVNWIDDSTAHPSQPLTTTETAARVRALLRAAVTDGAANAADRSGLNIGGQVAVAYSGEQAQSWFVGYVQFADGGGAAIAVVVEEEADPAVAANIGGAVLALADERLNRP
jgi:peptidoglycan glycosyltransferase